MRRLNQSILFIFTLFLTYSCGSNINLPLLFGICPSEIGCNSITSSDRALETIAGFTGTDTEIYNVNSDSMDSIYVAGQVDAATKDAYIIKFNLASESIDTGFGTAGALILTQAQKQYFANLHINGSSIFAAGLTDLPSGGGQTDMLITKVNAATGTLDTSFNTTGIISQAYAGGWYDSAYSTSVLSDGKVYSCGYAYTGGVTGYDAVVSRYSSAGVLDTSFGASGHLIMTPAGNINVLETCYKVFELSSGKILVYGVYTTAAGTDYQPYIRRYNSDWSVDTTFATAGVSKISLTSPSLYSLAAYAGKLLIEGDYLYLMGKSVENSGDKTKPTIVKINIDTGALDTSFGTNGVFTLNPTCKAGDDSGISEYKSFNNTLLIRGSCFTTARSIPFVTSVLKTGAIDPWFNGGDAFYYLEDVQGDSSNSGIFMKKSSEILKVYVANKGSFKGYDLNL